MFILAQIKAWAWITNKNPKVFFSFSKWCLFPTTCLQILLSNRKYGCWNLNKKYQGGETKTCIVLSFNR